MKQDDRGVSLVEILIATAILVICVVPLFKSMILTVQTNARSRVLLAATSAGEAVLEDLKADGMEAFIQDKAYLNGVVMKNEETDFALFQLYF